MHLPNVISVLYYANFPESISIRNCRQLDYCLNYSDYFTHALPKSIDFFFFNFLIAGLTSGNQTVCVFMKTLLNI